MDVTHLALDITSKSESLDAEQDIEDFIIRMARRIDMKILAGPFVVRGKFFPGVSGVAIIETSHISIHTFTESCHANIDIFSCKKFDADIVMDFVKTFFDGEIVSANSLSRLVVAE